MGFFKWLKKLKKKLLSFFHIKLHNKKHRKHYPKDLKSAMKHINKIRKKHGLNPIEIDDRALKLAKARLRDLNHYHYFAHVNPQTGLNPESIKGRYGFARREYVAENLYGGGISNDMHGAIKAWMNSPGHRRNLLFSSHTGGAIVAYRGNVAFIGVNPDGLGAVYY